MKIAGIIAEYNPFHRGHKFHIERTREQGATHIVVVMSGSLVQRGDVAISDAHARAEAAVFGGADLVLELPPQHSLAAARDFARAGVSILSRLGCVDLLSFGAETADLGALRAALDEITANELEIKAKMSAGLTYPQAAAEVSKSAAKIISGQNNTLALEYLRALENSGIAPFAVGRTVPHDSEIIQNGYVSASKIRVMLSFGEDVSGVIDYDLDPARLCFLKNGEKAALYRLSMMSQNDFLKIRGCKELAGRLYEHTRRAKSLEEIYSAVKSRNFTHARVRRAVLSAVIGITEEDCFEPPFARVLALNGRGAEILKLCRKTARIPIGSSLKELSKTSPEAGRTAELIERASRFSGLCGNGGESEFRKSAKIIRSEE